MVLHFFSDCSSTQTLAISSGQLLGKDLSKTNVRLDICLCTEQTTGSSSERGDEVKFHSSGITILILYFVSSCGFIMPLTALFIPDAFSLPLSSLLSSAALTLSGQLSELAEAQLMKR